MIKKLVVAALPLTLAGCIQFFPDPADAPGVYRLQSDYALTEYTQETDIVAVAVPRMPRALAGTAITLATDEEKILFADKARWEEPVPRMLQTELIKALSSHDALVGIRPGTGLRAKFSIDVDVERFEAVFDNGERNAPLAIYEITVSLQDLGTRELLGTRKFTASQRATGRDVASIVAAMSEASETVSLDLADWAADKLDAYTPDS